MNKLTLPGRKACALNMIRKGYSLKEIVEITNMSRNTLHLLKKSKQLFRKEKKTKITPEMENYLRIFFKNNSIYQGGSLDKVRQLINEVYDVNLKSVMPIRNWLKKNKYRNFNKIIVEKIPKRIISKRLGFCRKYSKDNQISNKILFTDEKTFNLTTKLHRGDKFRAPFNQRKAQRHTGIKFSAKYFKVAAGISSFGKTELIFLNNKFNGMNYAENVLPIYFSEIEKHKSKGLKFLMHNGSKIHHEKVFVNPMLKKFNILDWPPRSPDLNPIENLWAYLSHKMMKYKPENLRQLSLYLKNEYEKIPHSLIENLCKSFRSRLLKCIDMSGQMIS